MKLIPAVVLASVTDITPEWMEARGLRGLLLDLDNTLAPYRVGTPDAAVREWIDKMRGYVLVVLSNAAKRRVEGFCGPLRLPYSARAGKPSPVKALRACESFGLSPRETAIVGDQIFTDVLCANRAGMLSVIVEPFKRSLLIDLRRNVMERRYIRKGGENG